MARRPRRTAVTKSLRRVRRAAAGNTGAVRPVSGRQFGTTPTTACGNDRAAGAGAHALSKPVSPRPATVVRLERALALTHGCPSPDCELDDDALPTTPTGCESWLVSESSPDRARDATPTSEPHATTPAPFSDTRIRGCRDTGQNDRADVTAGAAGRPRYRVGACPSLARLVADHLAILVARLLVGGSPPC